MDERLDNLEKKIDMLTDIINNQVVEECQKMGKHISFIENVYATVKAPLEYICTYFTYISLPSLEKKKISDN